MEVVTVAFTQSKAPLDPEVDVLCDQKSCRPEKSSAHLNSCGSVSHDDFGRVSEGEITGLTTAMRQLGVGHPQVVMRFPPSFISSSVTNGHRDP